MDHLTSATQLLECARAAGIKIATAESCTGGLVAGAITQVAGSSLVFDRGFVTYSNDAKMQMLGVLEQTLEKHGAVSEAVAAEMALGALAHSDAGIAVSVTGIAGPGGSQFKPEGRVCFGLALSGMPVRSKTCDFGALGRTPVRTAAVAEALQQMIEVLS